MSRVDGYNLYQKNYTPTQIDVDEIADAKHAKDARNAKNKTLWNPDGMSAYYDRTKNETSSATYSKPAVNIKSTSTSASLELSPAAQSLLEELKAKYSDMDFVIANYSSEEEAQSLMAGGTKSYTCLIEPEVLEQMARDESIKEQYLGQIDDARGQMDSMLEELGDEAEDVESIGVSIKADGTVSYFAKMKEDTDKYYKEAAEERAKKHSEERAKKAKEEKEHFKEIHEKQVLTADSIEDLLEKIHEKINSKSEVEEKAAPENFQE